MSKSDAALSSDFTVFSLSQIEMILREGRAGEAKVIEIGGFIKICGFIVNITTCLIINDMALIEALPALIRSATLLYFSPIIIAITPAANKLTPLFLYFNYVGS